MDVLVDAFEELIEADPRAFRRKFRKMAADPFAFYRGSALLFYADVAAARGPVGGRAHRAGSGSRATCTPRTTAPTWTPPGILVFDVNDFDEAYLGHFTWDLQRMAASLALLGFAKALSDETIARDDRHLRARLRRAGARVRDRRPRRGVPPHARDHRRARCATFLQVARGSRRASDLLESTTTASRATSGAFADGPGVRRLEDDERDAVLEAYAAYLETIPETKRQQSVSYEVKDVVGRTGFGIGSAGLPAYNLLDRGPHARRSRTTSCSR